MNEQISICRFTLDNLFQIEQTVLEAYKKDSVSEAER